VLSGLSDAYRGALVTWLERRKHYPSAARRQRLEGRVVLRIVVERDGSVSHARIASSSGHESLDRAALALIDRAGRAPPLPDGFRADRVEITVPLSYSLSSVMN
jgi:protein TonB